MYKCIDVLDYINFFIVNIFFVIMGILDMPWYDRPGNRLIKEGAEIVTESRDILKYYNFSLIDLPETKSHAKLNLILKCSKVSISPLGEVRLCHD